MKKRILPILLSLLLIAVGCFMPASADREVASTYEVVLMVDVSGSMNQADPDRICMQAAKAFAYYHPAKADYFKVSVVLYSTGVSVAAKGLDVTKESGMEAYQNCLTTIAELEKGGKYNGFTCWRGDTDIGAAMKEAESILLASTAEKRAAILFTDGKIDLDNNFSITTKEEATSEQHCYDAAKALGEKQIPIYTVGLNRNGSVDRNFLQKLADETGGQCMICSTADDLVNFFQAMYAYFVGGTVISGTSIKTQANVVSSHQVNIYGQAISEANLVLFSTSEINSFKVTNPNGAIIAQRTKDGKTEVADGCILNYNNYTVNVKLLQPTDGVWDIQFTSATSGTVQVGEIYLYNLKVESDAPTKIMAGEEVNLAATLFNADTDSRITTQAIYETSTCTVAVRSEKRNDLYTAKLNGAKNGYTLTLPITEPGKYEIIYRVDNEQFSVETKSELEVMMPQLILKADQTKAVLGDTIAVTAQVLNPTTNKPMKVPSYLDGFRFGIAVGHNASADAGALYQAPGYAFKEGDTADTITFTLPIEHLEGKYSIYAELSCFDVKLVTEKQLEIGLAKPELRYETAPSANLPLGESLTLNVGLYHPTTGQPMSFDLLGNYMTAMQILAKGSDQPLAEFPAEKSSDGLTLTYKPTFSQGGEELTLQVLFKGGAIGEGSLALSTSIAVRDRSFKLEAPSGPISMDQPSVSLKIVFTDLNGEAISGYPEALADASVTLVVNGKEMTPISIAECFGTKNGMVSFKPSAAGNYSLEVRIVGSAQSMTQQTAVTVSPSTISVKGDKLPDQTASTLGGTHTFEIDLSGFFTDSDGDALNIQAKGSVADIQAAVAGNKLTVKVPAGSEGMVMLMISDGRGAEITTTFAVSVSSLLPLVIGIAAGVLVIAIAIPVILIIIKKRKVIRIRYRIKLVKNGEFAVYEIAKAANNARAKAKMTVREILEMPSLTRFISGDLGEESREELIRTYCTSVTLEGYPFKDGFRIFFGGKEKSYTGTRTQLMLPSLDPENKEDRIEIWFGRLTDFRDEDLY